jgi:hypothetical protein
VCADGVTRSLRQAWGEEPLAVRLFTSGIQLLRHPQFKKRIPDRICEARGGDPVTPRVAFFTDSYTRLTAWLLPAASL